MYTVYLLYSFQDQNILCIACLVISYILGIENHLSAMYNCSCENFANRAWCVFILQMTYQVPSEQYSAILELTFLKVLSWWHMFSGE